MRKAVSVLCLWAVLGCGDDAKSSAEERLEGDWFTEWDEYDCVDSVYFDAGYFEWNTICGLTGGGVGIEVRAGVYEIDGDRISWEYTESSCPLAGGPLVPARISFVDGRLRLVWPDGVVIFERPPGSGGDGGGAADFGCFDEAGAFEPRPIRPLP